MDNSDCDISWSSSDAAALLASLDPGFDKPPTPPGPSEVSVCVGGIGNTHAPECAELWRLEQGPPKILSLCSLSSVGTLPSVSRGQKVVAKQLCHRRTAGPPLTALRPTRQAHPGSSDFPHLQLLDSPRTSSRSTRNRTTGARKAVHPYRSFPSDVRQPRVCEDRRNARDAYRPPPSSPRPSSSKEVRVSEDRRISRKSCCPSPDSHSPGTSAAGESEDRRILCPALPLSPLPLDGLKVEASEDRRIPRPGPGPHPFGSQPPGTSTAGESEDSRILRPALLLSPLLLNGPKVEASEDRRIPRPGPCPNPPDIHPLKTTTAGESEDCRILRPTPLLAPLPPTPLSPIEHQTPAVPKGKPRKRRTCRAGRKNQLRRLVNLYRGFNLSGGTKPASLCDDDDARPDPPPPVVDVPPRGPRIIADIPYRGPRITKWRLIPIQLNPVVYSATIPLFDPRREIYLRKRAKVLYPLPCPL